MMNIQKPVFQHNTQASVRMKQLQIMKLKLNTNLLCPWNPKYLKRISSLSRLDWLDQLEALLECLLDFPSATWSFASLITSNLWRRGNWYAEKELLRLFGNLWSGSYTYHWWQQQLYLQGKSLENSLVKIQASSKVWKELHHIQLLPFVHFCNPPMKVTN